MIDLLGRAVIPGGQRIGGLGDACVPSASRTPHRKSEAVQLDLMNTCRLG